MTHTPNKPASTDDTPDRSGDEPPFPQEPSIGSAEEHTGEPDRRESDPAIETDPTVKNESETRTVRARTEPMTIRPTRDRRYIVETDGGTYVVSLDAGSCTCPDAAIRGARCKHRRRVAMEVTNGTVPAPDERISVCAVCGRETFVSTAATGSYLCETHQFEPGETVRDRETGNRLVVTAVTSDRADVVETDEGRRVSEYATNADYGSHEPVIEAEYVDSARESGETAERKRYRFPASRLRRTSEDDYRDRMQTTRKTEIGSADRADA